MNQAYKAKVKQYNKYVKQFLISSSGKYFNIVQNFRNSAGYAIIQMLCKRDVNTTVAHGINDWSILNNFITNVSKKF